MGGVDINKLIMGQYLALTRGNQVLGVVKPEIGNNINFEIKGQFMRELREHTFSGNKNDDAHEHVERVLDIFSLFSIPGVTHDVIMLRVFLSHLLELPRDGLTRYLQDRSTRGTFSRKPLSKDIVLFLRPSNSLRRFITSSKKATRHFTKIGEDGIAVIISKLDSLGGDMKKLKDNINGVEEVKYGEFGRYFPNNGGSGARYHVGPPAYYTRMDNRPPFGEKKPSLKETINKHIEESTKSRAETKKWMKKLQEHKHEYKESKRCTQELRNIN
ncbi:hypothetical protein Tco_0976435 [Tanacetum coccineum]|uniref:Uncharacterized protein n=1 Tax=Tanacetum coccineum TaxID=301880 RepID=A0ABQ5EH85_9ASTR